MSVSGIKPFGLIPRTTHIYMYTCIHTYVHIHVYTYMHMHTCMQMEISFFVLAHPSATSK